MTFNQVKQRAAKWFGVTMRKAVVTGAQTDRPNDAEPARILLGGKDSPAVF